MMLIAWPALGLAGAGAIVQVIGLRALSPIQWCPLDGAVGYVTQEAVAGIPSQELAALNLKSVSAPSGGVVFVMEDGELCDAEIQAGVARPVGACCADSFSTKYLCESADEKKMMTYWLGVVPILLLGTYCLHMRASARGWSVFVVAMFINTVVIWVTHAVMT